MTEIEKKYEALNRQILALLRNVLLEDHLEEVTPELLAKAEEVIYDMRSTALAAGWYRKD